MTFLGIPVEVASKIVLTAAILGGALMCFFGNRLFKVALGAAGFVAGSAIAAYAAWRYPAAPWTIPADMTYPQIVSAISGALDQTAVLVLALSGGVVGALLCVLMHRVGVFVLGVWLGAMLANVTMVQAQVGNYLMVLAILGLIGGVLALIMRQPILIISTALSGALALMFGIFALLKRYSPEQAFNALQDPGNDAYVLLGCAVLLAVIGGYVQFSTAPGQKKEGSVYKKVKKSKKDG